MYLFNIFILTVILILLPASITFAESNSPSFQDAKLRVPHVSTSELVGKYQDVIFQFNEQTGSWDLIYFKEALIAPIDQVEITVTDSFPVQVFLEVSGYYGGCSSSLNPVNQQLKDNQFNITISEGRGIGGIGGIGGLNGPICAASIQPFVKVIPLLVYGLDAGSYEYNVNSRRGDVISVFSGTFTLAEDNRFPIDETPPPLTLEAVVVIPSF